MATGARHYAEAERLLHPPQRDDMLLTRSERTAAALVHATLAVLIAENEELRTQREAVLALHRPEGLVARAMACLDGMCAHEDECPEQEVQVCVECDDLRERASREAAVILWPCATARALGVES